MCTVPVPPPLPSASLPNLKMCNPINKSVTVDSATLDCKWASHYPELQSACLRNNICQEKPYKINYRYFESVSQVGPTCGLVALSMLVNGEVETSELLEISKMSGYSNNGEMFSCRNMVTLSKKIFSLIEWYNVSCALRKGGLYSDEIIEKLLNGAVLMVAYDADFNHSPCLKNGHKAHWALVVGVMIVRDPGRSGAISYTDDPDNVYVLCKHGKTKHLNLWKLHDLARSNRNLWQFSPLRDNDGLLYVLPDGGIGGDEGLRNQFLIFEGI